jgi:hypothetical protein
MHGTAKWIFLSMLLSLFLGVGSAQADQLFVCQSCTSAPGGTLIGGEGNGINNTSSFNVGVAGSGTDDNPLLIVVGVYNGSTTGTVSVSFGGSNVSTAALGTYGLTSTSLSVTSGDLFQDLGLTSGGSISFGNLSTIDTKNGFAAPTSLLLDVFAVPTAISGTISIDESGAAGGSFILAYSCKSGASTTTACSNGDVSQTVNTNVGMLTSTSAPEPGTLALLSTGLIALGGIARRRFTNS